MTAAGRVPGTYRKRPVLVEALAWDGTLLQALEVQAWLLGHGVEARVRPSEPMANAPASLFIPTLEGTMEASAGDWIIRGVKGEFYPCKGDVFAATYEAEEPGLVRMGEAPWHPSPMAPLSPTVIPLVELPRPGTISWQGDGSPPPTLALVPDGPGDVSLPPSAAEGEE